MLGTLPLTNIFRFCVENVKTNCRPEHLAQQPFWSCFVLPATSGTPVFKLLERGWRKGAVAPPKHREGRIFGLSRGKPLKDILKRMVGEVEQIESLKNSTCIFTKNECHTYHVLWSQKIIKVAPMSRHGTLESPGTHKPFMGWRKAHAHHWSTSVDLIISNGNNFRSEYCPTNFDLNMLPNILFCGQLTRRYPQQTQRILGATFGQGVRERSLFT